MARHTLVMILIAMVAFAYTVYANGQDTRPATPPQEMVTITTTTPMSGTQPIPIVVGQKSRFNITLESNPTTGYSWRLAKPLDANILKNTGSIYNEPKSDLVGVPGNEIWTFQPANKGTTTFTMEYVRPWEKDAEPAKTQVFKITVQ